MRETAPEASRSPAGDYLLVAGEGRLSTHPFGAEATIGRGDDCDVAIAHHELSRRHALRCVLSDFGAHIQRAQQQTINVMRTIGITPASHISPETAVKCRADVVVGGAASPV